MSWLANLIASIPTEMIIAIACLVTWLVISAKTDVPGDKDKKVITVIIAAAAAAIGYFGIRNVLTKSSSTPGVTDPSPIAPKPKVDVAPQEQVDDAVVEANTTDQQVKELVSQLAKIEQEIRPNEQDQSDITDPNPNATVSAFFASEAKKLGIKSDSDVQEQ
tara:strand:- start:273 stop:758 length:486 start_codon:yes stop_codon:yes gene_type:complete